MRPNFNKKCVKSSSVISGNFKNGNLQSKSFYLKQGQSKDISTTIKFRKKGQFKELSSL